MARSQLLPSYRPPARPERTRDRLRQGTSKSTAQSALYLLHEDRNTHPVCRNRACPTKHERVLCEHMVVFGKMT